MDDGRIIELYWARDEEAIARSERKYGAYCRSVARRILESAEDAEECVGDTWLRAWNAIPPRRPAALRAFLAAITRNLCLDRLRDASREKRGGGQAALALDELLDCVPSSSTPESALDARELTRALESWLRGLETPKRAAFLRRYWYCDSVSEVAERMGWTEGKTASLLRRTRLELKRYLEQEGVSP